MKDIDVWDIWAVDESNVWAIGSDNVILKTQDGGAQWDSLLPADNFNYNEWIGVCSSGNTFVIYGGKSHYLVSTDEGTTWRNDSVPAAGGGGGADINHLIMLNPKTWWGAFDMGYVCLTTDGGSAFEQKFSGARKVK